MDALRRDVYERVIAPRFRDDTADLAAWRSRWRGIANRAEALSHALFAVATVASFAAGFFEGRYVIFAAGCLNVTCLALRGFSGYANRESSERNLVLRRLLSALGIPHLPDLVADPDDRGAAGEAPPAPDPSAALASFASLASPASTLASSASLALPALLASSAVSSPLASPASAASAALALPASLAALAAPAAPAAPEASGTPRPLP